MLSEVSQQYLPHFAGLVLLCAYLQRRQHNGAQSATEETSPQFKKFQSNYLLVYFVMMMADWMQGPYVYALYREYNFSPGTIGLLFIAGFGSSMVFGTIVGSAADKYGRKMICVAYGVIYIIGCITKHFKSFEILLVGRVCGGIATSILFSGFESWMLHEHQHHGYSEGWLSQTFARATFGNGLVAIVAGLIATVAKDNFGIVAPFDASICFLLVGIVIITSTWSENYGNAQIEVHQSFSKAWTVLQQRPEVLLIGVVQSLFEGVMYVFVFMWTPALETASGVAVEIPHGVIFACFMVCLMVGSTLFKDLLRLMPVERALHVVLLCSILSFTVTLISTSTFVTLTAFFLFEVCCGLYFPAMGTIRSRVLPEDVRSTLMNIFRVPLNLIVVLMLKNIETFTHKQVFSLCTVLLVVALVLQQRLIDTLIGRTADAKDEGAEEQRLKDVNVKKNEVSH
eukprot:GILJ01000670.1.p1 GENE.GILJ01000670.1~~GILJ01000670.1.p1  ORF type:complete len:467 (-),score=77.70 GILJ01000670.1:169-1533(-)